MIEPVGRCGALAMGEQSDILGVQGFPDGSGVGYNSTRLVR